MTYAIARYKSYQEYLDDESLSPEGNCRLLSTGELIEVASEDDDNLMIAYVLSVLLSQINEGALVKRIRIGNKEIQVPPVGDKCVNRKPDVMVLRPEHREVARQAIKFGMQPPLFVAEVVPWRKKQQPLSARLCVEAPAVSRVANSRILDY